MAAELSAALPAEAVLREPPAAVVRAMALDRLGVPPSLAVLLDRVLVESTQGAADASSLFAALDDLGRALCLIGRSAPLEPTRMRLTQHAALESFGIRCRRLAELWPHTPGRLGQLTAVAADIVAADAGQLDDGQRWAVGIELGSTAARLIESACLCGPYDRLADVERARRTARAVRELGRRLPPGPVDRVVLDRPIVNLDSPGPSTVAAAAAGLSRAVEADARAGVLDVRAALAACTAAESAAQLGVEVADHLSSTDSSRGGSWRRAPQAWQVLNAALVRFDDGGRRRGDYPGATREWAQRLHEAALSLLDPQNRPAEADAATAARATANQLPTIAGHLHSAISGWADAGRLIARARHLPRSGEHVDAVVHNRFVIATPGDVGPVLLAAQVTARLAAAQAGELHRSAEHLGIQPQPHLAAALAAQSRQSGLGREAAYAERLADRCRQTRVALAG